MRRIERTVRLSGGLLIAAAALALTSLPACGDDDTEANPGSGGSKATGGTKATAGSKADGGSKAEGGSKPAAGSASEGGSEDPGDGGAAGSAPEQAPAVYALTTQVFGETENQSYVLLTNTLDSDTSLELEDAVVEIAGRALGTGPEGAGLLFVAGELAPTITRYELTADGSLAGRGTVSFLGKGVTSFGEYGGQFQYVSAEKAYWFDGPTSQIVVWNPTTMKVLDSIALPTLPTEGQTLSFTAAPIWDGEMLYTFAAWREGLAITPRLAIVVVDTAKDEATVIEDTRCGYVRDGVLTEDGMLYVATEAFGSAAHYLNAANPKPCLLRFDTSTAKFDTTFKVELSTLFDGSSAGTLVVGPDNQAFLRVLDAAEIPADTTNPRLLASLPVWSWAKLTPGDEPEVEAVEGVALGGGSVLPFKLGSRTFSPLFVDGEETQFIELTKEGPSTDDAITVPGLVFSAVKLK